MKASEKEVKAKNVQEEIPNVAAKACQSTVAAVVAANGIDHWRIDTDIPEEAVRVVRNLVKAVQSMLWFTDSELGWNYDDFSRKDWIAFLKNLSSDWRQCPAFFEDDTIAIRFCIKSNGQGMGRLADNVDNKNDKNKSKNQEGGSKKNKKDTATTTTLAADHGSSQKAKKQKTIDSFFRK